MKTRHSLKRIALSLALSWALSWALLTGWLLASPAAAQAQPAPAQPAPAPTPAEAIARAQLMRLVAQRQGEARARTRVAQILPWAKAQEVVHAALLETKLPDATIDTITLRCVGRPCDEARMLALTGLRRGSAYSARAVRRAEERLLKTGLFTEVITSRALLAPEQQEGAPPEAARVALTLEAQSASLVRNIRFVGLNPPPFLDELRKVLMYREGQPYIDDLTRKNAQLSSLQDVFRKEGFFDVRITMVVERPDGVRGDVEITFVIQRGVARRICRLGMRGVALFRYAEARDYLLEGSPLWERRLDLWKPSYTDAAMRLGQEKLLEAYRERGYLQARVLNRTARPMRDAQEGCLEVLFDVSEGLPWTLVFEGNTLFNEDELRAVLPFMQTGYVDAASVRTSEEGLRRLYATRGYPFAQISGRIEATEEPGEDPQRRLVFTLVQGDKVEIRRVVIKRARSGAPAIDDATLLEGLLTQPFRLFEAGGYLQYDALLSDALTIEQRYRERGFLQASVLGFEVTPSAGEEGAAIDVVIRLREGAQTRVESARFEGNRRLPLGTLRNIIKLSADKPFVPVQLKADNSRIVQRYGEFGYPMAQVETRCDQAGREGDACEPIARAPDCLVRRAEELWGQEAAEAGARADVARLYRRVKDEPQCKLGGELPDSPIIITHIIREGPYVTVGDVLIRGNFITSRSLIANELPLRPPDATQPEVPAEAFDVKKLLEGQANLRSLGLFNSVSVEAIGLDDGARDRAEATASILISVEEGDYQVFNVSGGIQGRDLTDDQLRRLILLGDIQYANRNLLGLGQRLVPRLLLGVDSLQLLSLASDEAQGQPTQVDTLVGVELTYSNPRFLKRELGLERLLLTIAPYYMRDFIGVQLDRLQREELGVRTELRKELIERFFVTFGLQGRRIATRSITSGAQLPDGSPLFSPRRTIAKMYLDAIFDRRDSPLNPTTGYYIQLNPQWVSGDAVAGDLSNAIESSFFRMTVGGARYWSVRGKLVFGQSLRFGQILPLLGRDRPVPDEERYILGGVTTLRGIPDAGIITSSTGGLGQLRGGEFVLNSNSELRYPLLSSAGIYAATFMDAGILADCFDDADTSQRISCWRDAFPSEDPLAKLRVSTGLGLRYLLVDQIPILLDYAILLNRRPGEGFSQLHFNVGYTF